MRENKDRADAERSISSFSFSASSSPAGFDSVSLSDVFEYSSSTF